MTYRKKLIEVALPLDAINAASAKEKSIRQGHPSTLHLWWSRKPLATCRAVIFASLVDDPSSHSDRFPTDDAQEKERQRLFDIIENLVRWENSNSKDVLDAAWREIEKSTNGNPPPILDPFCGGGSIPLEAERLGLKAFGSDLNPVAVLVTKALIEIPPVFSGRPSVNPESRAKVGAYTGWVGAKGLADDTRYYGQWMRNEAQRRIGYLYPKVRLPKEYGQGEATVIAWLWARTVTCPNPACRAEMPLTSKWWLSTSTNPDRKAWIEPIVDRAAKTVRFEIKTGQGAPPSGTVNRRGATCIVCNTPVPFDYVRAEGRNGRMGARLIATVAEWQRRRVYLSPAPDQEAIAYQAEPTWMPETSLPDQALGFRVQLYGMTTHRDLFTLRQLAALSTFSTLVNEAREQIERDAIAIGLANDGVPLAYGGTGATAYADAVTTYLALGVSRLSDICNSLCRWETSKTQVRNLFSRQAISMVWDYAEPNIFAKAAGDLGVSIDNLAKALEETPARGQGKATQLDATNAIDSVMHPLISTDPPYYDNIGYADLSDFFYVWLRHALNKVYPDLFRTLLTPKAQELISASYRFDGSKDKAQRFFEEGLGTAFGVMRAAQHPDYPMTVYYAFKQAESEDEDEEVAGSSNRVVASTGWETMLEGLLQAKFTITGTWPMRTELSGRVRDLGSNALASSIVLVCRPRPNDASITTRREFLNALKRELPGALRKLQHGNIAPVDLAQATIGPGMAIFSRHSRVMEADGSPMRVRTALQLINQALDEVLAEQEGEFDADTRWALAWFEQFGTGEGQYGVAETLSKAKNTSVAGLAEAGLLIARGGKVRLLQREELSDSWEPSADSRLTIWETTQYLIRTLDHDGEYAAGALLAKLGEQGDIARDLAYRLYSICERKGWADEALAYNSLVIAWPQIQQLASQQAAGIPRQQEMFT